MGLRFSAYVDVVSRDLVSSKQDRDNDSSQVEGKRLVVGTLIKQFVKTIVVVLHLATPVDV